MRSSCGVLLASVSLLALAASCKTPETAKKDMLRDARLGCDRGSAPACWHAGLLYGEAGNTERSEASHVKACSLKYWASCDALAQITGPNRENILATACGNGDLVTCTRLADSYPRDPSGLPKARALYEQVCRAASAVSPETHSRHLQGAASACARLAVLHTKGDGGKPDAATGIRLDTLATTLYTDALFRLEKEQDAAAEREIANGNSSAMSATEKDRIDREGETSRTAYEAFLQTLDSQSKPTGPAEAAPAKASSPVSVLEEAFVGNVVLTVPRAETAGGALDDASHCKDTGDVVSCTLAASAIDKTDPAGALELHRAGCAKRPDQCWSLVAYADAALRKKDAPRAVQILEKGCELKAGNACYRLASEYEQGERGIPQDLVKAAKTFEKACDAGHARSCLTLATQVEDGRGPAKNPARAKQLHSRADGIDAPPRRPPPPAAEVAAAEQACRQTRAPAACLTSGTAAHDTDAVKAEELYRIGCTASGNKAGCGLWGFAIDRYRRDDASRGTRILEQGCQEGSPDACAILAEVLHLGYRTVPRGEARAAELFQKACDLGDAFSCRGTAARFRAVKNATRADELRDKAQKSDDEVERARGDADRWARELADQRSRGPHAQELTRALAEWRALVEKARGRAQARTKRLESAYAGRRLPTVPPFAKEDTDASAAREATVRRLVTSLFFAKK